MLFILAAENGHLHILQWLYDEIGWKQLPSCALTEAAKNGHWHVCKWLLQEGCKLSSCAVERAAGNNHLDLALWLLEKVDYVDLWI
jgi:hypothetical protein